MCFGYLHDMYMDVSVHAIGTWSRQVCLAIFVVCTCVCVCCTCVYMCPCVPCACKHKCACVCVSGKVVVQELELRTVYHHIFSLALSLYVLY